MGVKAPPIFFAAQKKKTPFDPYWRVSSSSSLKRLSVRRRSGWYSRLGPSTKPTQRKVKRVQAPAWSPRGGRETACSGCMPVFLSSQICCAMMRAFSRARTSCFSQGCINSISKVLESIWVTFFCSCAVKVEQPANSAAAASAVAIINFCIVNPIELTKGYFSRAYSFAAEITA